jgi:hypothetical protein
MCKKGSNLSQNLAEVANFPTLSLTQYNMRLFLQKTTDPKVRGGSGSAGRSMNLLPITILLIMLLLLSVP